MFGDIVQLHLVQMALVQNVWTRPEAHPMAARASDRDCACYATDTRRAMVARFTPRSLGV